MSPKHLNLYIFLKFKYVWTMFLMLQNYNKIRDCQPSFLVATTEFVVGAKY